MFYPYRVVYAGKVFRFKEIANLDVSREELDYKKAAKTSLGELMDDNSCEERSGFTIIMRFGEVHDFMAFPRLSAQIDLMVAEQEEVIVQILDEKGSILKTWKLHCATPVKIIDTKTGEAGSFQIGTMLWTVNKIITQ